MELDDNSLVGRRERAFVANEAGVENRLKAAAPTLTPAAAVGSQGHEKKGAAVKKREDVHKMAESNKAFAHFRW